MEISQQLIETSSWRLVTEVIRRAPHQLRVYEMHPGGGQYDCLSLYTPNERHVGDLNRGGSFHVWDGLDSGVKFDSNKEAEPLSIWPAMMAAEDPVTIVDEICRRIGLTVPAKLPSSTPAVLSYRFITELLSQAVFGRKYWECRNGVFDTSGWGGGIRREWFDQFPLAAERLQTRLDGDFLKQAAYRFWFVVRNGDPELCLETTGLVINRTGESIDLTEEYPQRRRIWPSILNIAEDLLH